MITRADDPLERVPGIVARACYVCVTLGRSTTPLQCFLLEYTPPSSHLRCSMHTNVRRIREARVTYDLLLPGKDGEEGDDEKQLRCIHRVFIRVFDIYSK